MKSILVVAALAFALPAFATKNVPVKPHVTKNGAYVPPSNRTAPNATKIDNYSTKGNANPYTGKEGTKNP